MITESTVLILGAGASVPYGFPTGKGLRDRVCKTLANPQDTHEPCRLLREQGFDFEHQRQFAENLRDSTHRTLDDFLISRGVFRPIAVHTIACEILQLEKGSIEKVRSVHDWCTELLRAIPANRLLDDNPITGVVTFNYDRSFEYAMSVRMSADHGPSFAAKTEELPMRRPVHVHGAVGDFPDAEYGQKITRERLSSAAADLKTTGDGTHVHRSVIDAWQLIEQSDSIIFLGFGFHPDDLLGLDLLSGNERISRLDGLGVYHACRTRMPPTSYETLGILPTSQERLQEYARTVFRGVAALPDVLHGRDREYFDRYEGTVSLYTTGLRAPACYLSGSHFMQRVAAALGERGAACWDKEVRATTPVIIKCCLPLDWLDSDLEVRGQQLYVYSSTVVREMIRMRKEGRSDPRGPPRSIVLRRSVSRGQILGFVDASDRLATDRL
jgi:hypothetical protein